MTDIIKHDEATNVVSAIEQGRAALVACRNDFERLQVRDQAKAAVAAAAILKRRDIQTQASILVAAAEREIAKANPPEKRGPKSDEMDGQIDLDGNSFVPQEDETIRPSTLRNFRSTHDNITDEDFEEICAAAEAKQEPVTRQTFRKVAKQHKAEAKVIAEREQIKQRRIDYADRAQFEVFCSPIDELISSGHIERESLDAIITDPPYPRQYLDCWDMLGEFAMQALKPGGVVAAMSGQSYLPEVLNRLLASGLDYYWTACIAFSKSTAAQNKQCSISWKPVVVACKGEYAGPWFVDLLEPTGNAPHELHKWGQNEQTTLDMITRWSKDASLICDPFCGSGTTGVAAIELDRKVILADIDPEHVQTTRERLGL